MYIQYVRQLLLLIYVILNSGVALRPHCKFPFYRGEGEYNAKRIFQHDQCSSLQSLVWCWW